MASSLYSLLVDLHVGLGTAFPSHFTGSYKHWNLSTSQNVQEEYVVFYCAVPFQFNFPFLL